MYIINYLAGRYASSAQTNVTSEYRLLCSGELYNSRVLTFEWRKSDLTRRLLVQPCSLAVVSKPFNDYPQELSLLIAAPDCVTESQDNFTRMFPPDDDIAKDIAALLTVFLRRLVTVYVNVRRVAKGSYNTLLPIAKAGSKVVWKSKPIAIATSVRGVESVTDYNPDPLGIDPVQLSSSLRGVAQIPHGETFILAARLYAQALQMIEDFPGVTYELLVYCAETMANSVFSEFLPPRAEMIEAKGKVAERAIELGLSKEEAEELAVLACSGMPWTFQKFRMFLDPSRNVVFSMPDDLFKVPSLFLPTAADFDKAISQVYRSRSKRVHQGKTHRPSVGLGTGPGISVDALPDIMSGATRTLPPVTWLERVVNVALNHYLGAELELRENIRLRAYEIYEKRGKVDGHDLDDWLKAEEELRKAVSGVRN